MENKRDMLKDMATHYKKGEDLDIQLTSICQEGLHKFLENKEFDKAINHVVEFFGPYIDIAHGGRFLISTIQSKKRLDKESENLDIEKL